MHGTKAAELKPIGPCVVGQFLGYVEKQRESERELLSLRRWHVVQVWPGKEAKVAAEIEKLKIGTYVPLGRIDRERVVKACGSQFRPLFKGYLFAGFDPAGQLWARLRPRTDYDFDGIDGFIRVLKYQGWPISIAESAMARIREIEAVEMDYRVVVPLGINVGATVRVLDYMPFTGLFGPVVEVDDAARRVLVKFDFAGGELPLWLNEAQFEVL